MDPFLMGEHLSPSSSWSAGWDWLSQQFITGYYEGFTQPPPEALQLVASVENQLSVEEAPRVTEVGKAESVTVGSGGVPEPC